MMCILATMNQSIRLPFQGPHVIVSLLFLLRSLTGVGFPEPRFTHLFDLVFHPTNFDLGCSVHVIFLPSVLDRCVSSADGFRRSS